MQRIKLGSNWIGWRQRCCLSGLRAQSIHARNDCELRDCSQREHQDGCDMAESKGSRPARFDLVVDPRAQKEDQATTESYPMKLYERRANYQAREMGRGEHGKRSLGKDRKKDERTQPDCEREQHQESDGTHARD